MGTSQRDAMTVQSVVYSLLPRNNRHLITMSPINGVFQLAQSIGRSVYRERWRDQDVAVRVVETDKSDDFLPALFDVEKSLLKLRHVNIARCLELVGADQPECCVR